MKGVIARVQVKNIRKLMLKQVEDAQELIGEKWTLELKDQRKETKWEMLVNPYSLSHTEELSHFSSN